ncbi:MULTISPECIES: Coq4 family protein [Henriciella]|jgi:ubiquinone biosynthesis protein COQ4|uniref:Coq4 family protein n=1 Tax=Henriciella TaxID=453849 RepID=UPI003516A5F9
MSATVVANIDPNRRQPKFRPLKAWSHMQKLIANKEDTEQVFLIIESLNGNNLQKDFERFLASDRGVEELQKRTYLPPILDQHGPLHNMPEGSVGRTYAEFMEREGLTAAGLVTESETRESDWRDYDDDLLWYANRLRDTHDMFHILTGYGRDALGEATLLGFTHSQHGGLGIRFINFMGGREISKVAPKSANIRAVLREGREHGKVAKRIIEQDILALLPRQLEDVRAELNINEPALYKRAKSMLEDAGIQPLAAAA